MVYTCNGMLFSHKKEQIWVISSAVNKPRVCQIKWNKSEGDKQILYINAYICNLESGTDESISKQFPLGI